MVKTKDKRNFNSNWLCADNNLFILIFSYLINLRIQNLKDDKTDKSKMIVGDGFDKFRVKHKLRTKAEQILENK